MFLNLGLGRMGCLVGALGISAALDLNFASGTFPPQVTHSRSSSATQVYSDGLVDFAPENLLLYSRTLSNGAWTGSNRTISDNTTADPPDTTNGTTADTIVENTAAAAFHWIAQAVTKPAVAEKYLFTGYCHSSSTRDIAVYLQNGANGCNARFRPSTGVNTGPAATFGSGWSSVSSTITPIGDGWHRFALQATSDGTTSITAQIALYNAAFSYTGDGVSGAVVYGLRLQRGTHSRAEDDYLVQTTSAAVYGARTHYDPVTLECLGYLNEPQRTNLHVSNNFADANWFRSTLTATASDVVGALQFYTIAGATGIVIDNAAVTITAGQPHTKSVFVLKATGSQTFSCSKSDSSVRSDVTLDASTGALSGAITVGAVTGVSNRVEDWDFAWRLIMTATTTAETDWRFCIRNAPTGTIKVAGVQGEAGSTASSYIPTTGTSATRAADVATITGAAFTSWFNSAQGCFVAEYTVAGSTSPSSVFAANDNSSNNRIDYRAVQDLAAISSGGSGLTLAISGTTGSNKVAVSYSASETVGSINGGTPVYGAGIGAIAATQLRIADIDSGGLLADYMVIKRIRYFNTYKSGAEAQALTT